MQSRTEETEFPIYVWRDEEGNKKINYDNPEGMRKYVVKYVGKEELKRIKEASSDMVQEILDFYID